MSAKYWLFGALCLFLATATVYADDEADATVEDDIGDHAEGSRTDDEAVKREEEAIKLDGLNVAQIKEMRDRAEKHEFQAEVSRMMKLIINSLYKNKEIFLRELISNSSDALDKIRFLSLTDKDVLSGNEELTIKIKADKEGGVLHVTDTGIGMTKADLVNNLGTIARSGTSEFLNKLAEGTAEEQSALIGQFGVGFYSSFLVSDRVVVTSKHNEDKQHIWESDAGSFSVVEDPRGDTLGRGTTVSLHLKEEAQDFLEPHTIKELVRKYSQFINFPIYLWTSKVEEEEKKPKTKSVEKTTWDWELMNENKPLWTRPPKEVTEEEYEEFYKSFSKDSDAPLAHTHFVAEGEVTFRSILFVPKTGPRDMFQEYGKKVDYIKLFVRRVFITDDFQDMMPKYLSFVKGMVDSDDLPLNVSRETLQQHKLLKVIKKKLVRKTLDMIKKMDSDEYLEKFWKEYSTSIKLGVIEDHSNRTRLAKLLRFQSSNSEGDVTSLAEYVERMKEKQEAIFFMAGTSRKEAESSPFVERLLKKGYEVLYLVEPVDEYCIQSLPEFDGKKFQNVAKDGLKIDESEKDSALKDQIEKARLSERLTESPCALVASSYGWSGNMERIMKAQAYARSKDSSQDFYGSQKKTLELNPHHPLVQELKNRVDTDQEDQTTKELAQILYDTATLRSGFMLQDSSNFANRIERMLRLSMNVDLNAKGEEAATEEVKDEL
ncbi:hypothetical protein Bbelb_104730 [Branchiostoma belcheri]|nr:hypothetical protein Bbelb_104730 [Branchiostoma belcheri]